MHLPVSVAVQAALWRAYLSSAPVKVVNLTGYGIARPQEPVQEALLPNPFELSQLPGFETLYRAEPECEMAVPDQSKPPGTVDAALHF